MVESLWSLFDDEEGLVSNSIDSPSIIPANRYRARSLNERLAQIQRGYAAFKRFFRFEYLTFSLLLPLLGATTVSTPPSTRQFIGLVAVALSFHIFMCLQNDLVDLPLDRTQPARAEYPLVKGTVKPGTALVLALIQIPIAFAVTVWLGAPALAFAALGLAFVAMTIYNVWGKRTPFPILTDVIQGLAFASVCLYGAALLGPFTTLTFVLFGGVVIWMVLTNLLGGLRDLASDLDYGVLTTPIQLGARPVGALGQAIPRRLRWYAFTWLALLIALIWFGLVQNDAGLNAGSLLIPAVLILSVTAVILLAAFFRASNNYPRMIRRGELQLATTSATAIVLLLPTMDPRVMLFVVIIFLLPQVIPYASALYRAWRTRRLRSIT